MKITFREQVTGTRPHCVIEPKNVRERNLFPIIERIIEKAWDSCRFYSSSYRRFMFEVGTDISISLSQLDFEIEYHPLKGHTHTIAFYDTPQVESTIMSEPPANRVSRFDREDTL